MSAPLVVCTYNTGADLYRYAHLCHYYGRPIEESIYREAEKKVVEILASSTFSPEKRGIDVYCLQEVVQKDKLLLKNLKERHFSIIYGDSEKNSDQHAVFHWDTAIALSDRFDEIVDHSIQVPIEYNGRSQPSYHDVAIATARDKTCGRRYTFVSAHIPSFLFSMVSELMQVSEEEKPGRDQLLQKWVSSGDQICRAIAEKITGLRGDTLQIIGADIGAHPEVWRPRFDIFSNHDFSVHAPQELTHINSTLFYSEKREKIVDFFLTKVTDFSLCSYTSSALEVHPKITLDSIYANSSNHRPVILTLF